jgi:hypothetical protein
MAELTCSCISPRYGGITNTCLICHNPPPVLYNWDIHSLWPTGKFSTIQLASGTAIKMEDYLVKDWQDLIPWQSFAPTKDENDEEDTYPEMDTVD